MELKNKYQYSYFIHPYVIEEKNYEKHILRLLKNKNCKLKLFEKEKDLNLYSYFLPKAKDYMFWSFEYGKEQRNRLENLVPEEMVKEIKKYPCNIFEYQLEKNMQAKMGEHDGIFFDISKIEIICFSTGICFVLLKTMLEEDAKVGDILNFNYKFRDINSDFVSLTEFENIRLQTNHFKDVKDLSELIKEIIGPNLDAKILNIDEQRFLTYSYLCLEQENWNEKESFDDINAFFIKYRKFLPNQHQINVDSEIQTYRVFQDWKYIKIGFSNQGTCLLTSGINIDNYTKLPFRYENEYLYTYILTLYQKNYLKKLNNDMQKAKTMKNIRKNFISFTKNIWNGEVTQDVEGEKLYKQWKDALELQSLYNNIKEKYEITYKDLNIEKVKKYDYTIAGILVIILLINIIALFFLF